MDIPFLFPQGGNSSRRELLQHARDAPGHAERLFVLCIRVSYRGLHSGEERTHYLGAQQPAWPQVAMGMNGSQVVCASKGVIVTRQLKDVVSIGVVRALLVPWMD